VDGGLGRLATHLLLAGVIYVALLWTARQLGQAPRPQVPGRVRVGAAVLLVLTLLQIYLGALVAGLRAGYAYNTWPRIDGAFVPDAARLFFDTPLWRNFFENILTVQFDHRMLAYVIFLVALAHALNVERSVKEGPARAGAFALFAAIALQVALGVATLLWRVPLPLALLHQAVAVLVLTLATLHAADVAAPVPRRDVLPAGAAGAN
jgi:cytochrome c oxidase assembly protein subunit 15